MFQKAVRVFMDLLGMLESQSEKVRESTGALDEKAVQVFAHGSCLPPFLRTWCHSCSLCHAFLAQSSKHVHLFWTRTQVYDLLFTTLIGVSIEKVQKQDTWVLSFFSRRQILPTRPWRVRNSINIGKRTAPNQPVFTMPSFSEPATLATFYFSVDLS